MTTIDRSIELTRAKLLYDSRVAALNLACHQYYTLDDPTMTDAQYDHVYRELLAFEKEHPDLTRSDSPTQRIAATVLPGFQTHRHKTPMLSIRTETDTDASGAYAFDQRVISEVAYPVDYVAELKFDGLAISLEYFNGHLQVASTRGDGETGENVTHTVKTIRQIPLRLPTTLSHGRIEVRGEAYLSRSDFLEINQQRMLAGDKPLVNTRNAAAGAIRTLDASVAAKRKLKFYAYALIVDSQEFMLRHQIHTQSEALDFLKQLGFPVHQYWKASSAQELSEIHDHVSSIRDSLDFDIDGVVYKVNSLQTQKQLGVVSKEPRWAVAHKFPPEEKISRVNAIDLQIGRTGKLTPVAKIDPVFVGGVTVTNATLHNRFEARRKGVRVGDIVVVRRAGDVVPEVVKRVNTARPEYVNNLSIPKACPACSSPTFRLKGETNYYCSGAMACSAQRIALLSHFCSKGAMDIDGVGESLITQLAQRNKLNSFEDIFMLKSSDISDLDGRGPKIAEKLLASIQASKKPKLNKFIFALGIRHVGETTARSLADKFGSIDKLLEASKEDLLKIPDIGEVVANSLISWRERKNNLRMLGGLLSSGIMPIHENKAYGKLTGKTVVITGSFDRFTRDQLRDLVISQGASVSGSVSKNTNYLFCGRDAGSKLIKANALGVTILQEEAITTLLGVRPR